MGYVYLTNNTLKQYGLSGYKKKGATGAWVRTDASGKPTSIIELGNRIKNKDGSYVQLNSDGTRTTLRDKNGNYSNGVSYADRVNMDANHIYLRKFGGWRLDTNDLNQKNVKTKSGDYGGLYFWRDLGNGKGYWANFDTGLAYSTDQARRKAGVSKLVENKYNLLTKKSVGLQIMSDGILSTATSRLMDSLGVAKDSNWRTAADIGSGLLYSVPIVGTALSIGDAAINFANGRYAEGLGDLAFGLIPGGKILKGTSKFALRNTPKLFTSAGRTALRSSSKGTTGLLTGGIKGLQKYTIGNILAGSENAKYAKGAFSLGPKARVGLTLTKNGLIANGMYNGINRTSNEYIENMTNAEKASQLDIKNRYYTDYNNLFRHGYNQAENDYKQRGIAYNDINDLGYLLAYQ